MWIFESESLIQRKWWAVRTGTKLHEIIKYIQVPTYAIRCSSDYKCAGITYMVGLFSYCACCWCFFCVFQQLGGPADLIFKTNDFPVNLAGHLFFLTIPWCCRVFRAEQQAVAILQYLPSLIPAPWAAARPLAFRQNWALVSWLPQQADLFFCALIKYGNDTHIVIEI